MKNRIDGDVNGGRNLVFVCVIYVSESMSMQKCVYNWDFVWQFVWFMVA